MVQSKCLRGLVFVFLATITNAYHWPSPQYDELERLLYEGNTELGNNDFSLFVFDCPSRPSGQSAAAEWLRFAYHDMSTHNVDDGTGGLDASLYYQDERDRPENIGSGMFNTILDFNGHYNKHLSRSDIIAIGVIHAIAECNGPLLAFRGGRQDALSAGPAGVPEPHQDLNSHIESFRRQGFTQSEMIGLVACGHTIGGVRSQDFPEIVPPTNPDVLEGVFDLFDTTRDFDNKVVTEYLDDTTDNPLVQHSNTTITSDLRIFSSDQNATMQSMASPEAFSDTCRSLLQRMLDTVPSTVTLTDPIEFLSVKVSGVQLSLPQPNSMTLRASLRINGFDPQSTVTMHWADRESTSCSLGTCSSTPSSTTDATKTLTQRMGLSPMKYRFVASIDPSTSVSKFWFEVTEPGASPVVLDNDGTGYEIQDRVLFVPAKSGTRFEEMGYLVVAAVRNDVEPTRVWVKQYHAENVMSPVVRIINLAVDPSIPPAVGYTYYSGIIPGFNSAFDLFSEVAGVTYMDENRETSFQGQGA